MKKSKLATATIAIALLIMLSATAQGAVIVIPELKVSPSNSHIFRVTGADFNTSTPVTLQLFNNSALAYKFTEAVSTNDTGKFEAVVIAPTSLSGAFNLTATTFTTLNAYNVTGTAQITLPNMTGPQGLQGVAGVNGTQGPQGEQGIAGAMGLVGEVANTDALVAGVALSIIISIGAVVVAWFKKK